MSKKVYPAGRTSVHLTDDVLSEIEREARRLNRSVSWMVRRAWTTARARLRAMPAAPDPDGDS